MADKKPTTTKKPKAEKQAASNIYQALFAFQGENLVIPRNGKGRSEKGKEYRYATLDDVINITREPLQRHGLMYTQTIYQNAAGETFLKTTLICPGAPREAYKEAPDVIETSVPLGKPGSAQDMGSRITYMRRYTLVPILGLSIEEDTDAVPVDLQPNPVPPVAMPSQPSMPETVVPAPVSEQASVHPVTPVQHQQSQNASVVSELKETTEAIMANAPKSYTHQRAHDAVVSCKNETALEVLKSRIENHKVLNAAEKADLLATVRSQEELLGSVVNI